MTEPSKPRAETLANEYIAAEFPKPEYADQQEDLSFIKAAFLNGYDRAHRDADALERELKEVNKVCGSLMKANSEYVSKSIQRIDRINELESANAELSRKLAICENLIEKQGVVMKEERAKLAKAVKQRDIALERANYELNFGLHHKQLLKDIDACNAELNGDK